MTNDLDRLLETTVRLTPQWLAGFFDGDGCVYAEVTKYNYPYVNVSISQVDPGIISLIAIKYGGKMGDPSFRKGLRPYHRVGWHGKDAKPILEVLKDYVICKKRQVELGLELFTDLSTSRITEISEELRALKKVGLWENPINSVPEVLS